MDIRQYSLWLNQFPSNSSGSRNRKLISQWLASGSFPKLLYQENRCFVVLSDMKALKTQFPRKKQDISPRLRETIGFCPFQRVERWILLPSWFNYLFDPHKIKSPWTMTELLVKLMRSVASVLPNVVHLKQWRKLLLPSWRLSIYLMVFPDILYKRLLWASPNLSGVDLHHTFLASWLN